MSCPIRLAHPVAYLLILAGCLLAAVSAFDPEPTGAYHLVAGYLVCGVIPYIVYGSCSDILDDCTLMTAGLVLLAADIAARMAWNINAAAREDLTAALVLCTVLVILVLPAGVLSGRLARRLFT